MLCSAAAHAQFVVTLRDGTNGYGGTRDLVLQDGSGTYGNPAANFDALDVSIDGYPFPRVTLMRFDVSAIPPGTTVMSAQLTTGVANTSLDSSPIFELLRPWSAPMASWTAPSAGAAWAAPGASGAGLDRSAASMGTVDFTPPWPFNATGVAAVQRWVDQPDANFGFTIQNFNTDDAFNLRHCDYTTVSSRPQLTVTHSAGTTTFRQGASPTMYMGCSDTTIVGAPPFGGNANGWGLVVSGSNPAGSTLVYFDVSVLPSDATVTMVQLQLQGSDPASDGFNIYEVLRPWNEATATWTTFDGVTPWTTPGANGAGTDRGATSLGTGNISSGANTYSLNATGAGIVQEWSRGTRPNRGLLLANFAAGNRGAWIDREGANLMTRPALIVTLTSPTWDGGLIFPSDAGAPDAGAADAGLDAGAPDSGIDAGVPDAGLPDAGSADPGAADAGADAGGAMDSGVSDAGAFDAGGADAGAVDAGAPSDGGMTEEPPPGDYGLGCACNAGDGLIAVALMTLLSRVRGRRSGERRGGEACARLRLWQSSGRHP